MINTRNTRTTISLSTADDALFVSGLPAPITPDDWRRYHLQSFPVFADPDRQDVAEEILRESIEAVYSMWVGVSYLWEGHDRQVWFEKTRLCYRLLICWYIADLYPEFSRGILSTGGLPIGRKKIGPIDITYLKDSLTSNSTDLLAPLLSNVFGAKAHLMIKTVYKRTKITNGNFNPVPIRRF
jgi:hypothetical protein